jgi:methionyl-tRNA formyltransferase
LEYLYLANSRLARDIARWLAGINQRPIAVVVHPAEKAKYREEIIEACGVPADRVFDGSRLREAETFAAIRALGADMCVSVLFDYILRPEFLSLFPRGGFNLHPALLPYNRGQYPNVWSIIEGTPAGVTLHRVDAGIDTGDIVEQRSVSVSPEDTGETLYRKLEQAGSELFREVWPRLVAGDITLKPQPSGVGSYHRTNDVDRIDQIELDRQYTGRELIDILRARTFPPYRGAYIVSEGRRIYLSLTLDPEQEA